MSFFFSSYHQNLDKIAFNGTTESMNLQKVFSIIIISIMSIAGISDNPIKFEQEVRDRSLQSEPKSLLSVVIFHLIFIIMGFFYQVIFRYEYSFATITNVQMCRFALYFDDANTN